MTCHLTYFINCPWKHLSDQKKVTCVTILVNNKLNLFKCTLYTFNIIIAFFHDYINSITLHGLLQNYHCFSTNPFKKFKEIFLKKVK